MRQALRFIGRFATPILACQGVALRRSLMVVAMIASASGAFAGANTNLPFVDTFETYTNLTPLISGTNGWYGDASSIIVQTNKVRTGTNAAMVPIDCTLSNRFQNMAKTNIWLQMDMWPSLYDGTNTPAVKTGEAVMFYVNSNGNFVVHDGPTADPSNSTSWVVTTNGGVGTNGTNWVQIGIYEDFTKTNWDLYANGILVTNGIRFINSNLTSFSKFSVYNGGYHTSAGYYSTSYMDNVQVRAPGTILVNPSSVPCRVMQGLAASNQSFLLAAQTGAWNFSNTSSAAWFAASPVTGVLDLATGRTNVVVSYGTMPNGSYTGTVTISATSVVGGVPRTETVAVSLDVMDLQVTPTNLTSSVLAGYMPSNQYFIVTNAGGGTFNYSVTVTNNWIQSCTPSNGTLGAFTSNLITVAYSNSITNWLGGISNTTIKIASADGGGATQTVAVAMNIVAHPVIELNPSIMTQAVDKGAYLTNQVFTVRNGSVAPVAPMQYTLAISNGSPSLIQSLSAVGGTSTGQANSVTVNFMDVSAMGAGVYTAMVQVVAWDVGDTYWPTGTVSVSTTLVVRVTVTALAAPSGITASDGTYADRVVVSWNPVTNAVKYKVYRSVTFDITQVVPIGETVATSFNDLSGEAGKLYYYWASSVNGYMGEGAMSTDRETGYYGLAAPGGIFATDGAYANKVRVTWPSVDGATGYQLYRGVEGGTLSQIYFTTAGEYEDLAVVAGVHYEYRVGATNGMFGSALSVSDVGYAFGVPENLCASDGTYVGKVRLTWSAVESASEYEVWRGTQAITNAFKMIGSVVTPTYDDTSVTAGMIYYYWVRGKDLLAGIGGWSAMDSGYGAAAGVDLWVTNLVVLPVQVGVGGSPAIVSFRMGNGGGTNMTGANGTVGMEFFASTNQVFGAGGEISIGKVVGQVTLGIGQDMVMKVDGGQVVLPGVEKDYYVFVQVLPESPSLLTDTNPNNNVAMRNGYLRVRSSGSLNYQALNDYDGDGISDLGVYRGMEWSIRSVDERVLIERITVFSGAGRPVLGDLDGDRRSDPIVYDSGSGVWQVLYSGSGYIRASGEFGGVGYQGLVADYEGVGHGDASIFHASGYGHWYVLTTKNQLIEWNWGAAGYEPVLGDYDGDGCWDLAVYQESTGLWYIRTLNGQLLVSGAMLGGPGHRPVPGDYDGDGHWDAALYQPSTGKWYIMSLDGLILAWGLEFGGPGFEPVMGDYDGDGKWDLGLYQEATGLWYIASLDRRILAWASSWGGSGYRPIGN